MTAWSISRQTDGVNGGDPPESGGPGSQDVRVADADRQRVAELLRRHTADGRLTLDEFAERVGVALAARTSGELDAVLADLPAAPQPMPETRRRRVTRWVVAVMSGAQRKGRWRPGSQVTAVAVMGSCELDFRRAEIDAAEVVVTAVAVMGGVDVIVPEGIDVELSGLPVMGGKQLRVADVPVLPGSPRIVVRAFPVMGGVTVRSKPDRAGRGAADGADAPGAGANGRAGTVPAESWQARQQRQQAEWERRRDEQQAESQRRQAELQHARQERQERRAQELERRNRRGLPIDLTDLLELVLPPAPRPARADGARPAPAPPAPSDPGPAASNGSAPEDPPVGGEDAAPGGGPAAVGATPDGTVTIMFSDICGYAAITDRLGDVAAHQLLREHNRIVREQLAAHGGYEVKSQGDGFMLAFQSASRALRCAVAIQQAFARYNADRPAEPIHVHLGLHTGEAVQDEGDFLGRTVIVASRLTGVAGPDQILVSALTRGLTDGSREFDFGPAREVSLKGVAATQIVFPVEWRATGGEPSGAPGRPTPAALPSSPGADATPEPG